MQFTRHSNDEERDDGEEVYNGRSTVAHEWDTLRTNTLAGMGMFAEAFVLFAVGNVKPLWKDLYPTCFGDTDTDLSQCNDWIATSLTYAETSSIMFGMIFLGALSSYVGRRSCSILTACVMLVGALLQMCVPLGPEHPQAILVLVLVGLTVFSFGVGGEYPIASASAAERAESHHEVWRHGGCRGPEPAGRGKQVVLTFAMQGWGNFVNTASFLIFLGIFGSHRYGYVWHSVYGVACLFILALLAYRVVFLEESSVWQQQSNESAAQHVGMSVSWSEWAKRYLQLFSIFWHRLIGTAGCWYVWDVVFYGNKLFQSTIIEGIIGTDASVSDVLLFTLLNSGVALIGYYVAAYTVDHMGRVFVQSMGFIMTFVLFLLCGVCYDKLVQQPAVFLVVYCASSFFGQWGPNATTWLLAAEVYPTDLRTEGHGFSAACGKAGALTATLMFSLANGGAGMEPSSIFLVCAACGIVGFVLTIVFVPDVTHLKLVDVDEYWNELVSTQNGEDDSDGYDMHEQHLSMWETHCQRFSFWTV